MMFDPAQEYWYLKDQTVDEVWVMKQYDSTTKDIAKCKLQHSCEHLPNP
jgi:hypothetical protein